MPHTGSRGPTPLAAFLQLAYRNTDVACELRPTVDIPGEKSPSHAPKTSSPTFQLRDDEMRGLAG